MSGDLTASGNDMDLNPFQLLPSDIKGIEDAAEYAESRGQELQNLTDRVQKMGMLKAFLDSKVARKSAGVLNVSFQQSNREKIKEEIIKYLAFFESMLGAVSKVDDENKLNTEKTNPYIIIIDLNKKITDLFEIAQSGLETTTSRAVSKLYKSFLARQSELENKMKKMECVFLKQQLMAETQRRDAYSDNVQNITDGGIAYKEQYFSYMTDEVENLREKNKELEKLVEETNQKMESLTKRFQDMFEKKQ